ncbi:uncharacterized protein N7484_005313 [Penicillium longicatenatum]|uniref:uncharacterized protein n=1 Tax=Penicillium longicatenatum TaxID=1561947 RepID=UPI00254889FC|nr:uncharacterized protein N7484_005313 [Penicillium longicatenatum]KAJ5651590.1 hypothetical protein N7484_005313 [Penicillium longicatenatum]
MPHIRGLPNEILLMIASFLDGKAIFTLGTSCHNLYNRLQHAFLEYKVQYQNSKLMHLAAKTNNISLAKAMLKRHADVNAFFRGKTPIMRALKHGATDIFRVLLKSPGVDINLQNTTLESALWALERLLATPGINVGRCAAGQSPFALAYAHGRVDAMKVLLHTDRVDINASGLGHLPICQAVEHGQVEAVRLLV